MAPRVRTVSLTEIRDAFGLKETDTIRAWQRAGMPYRDTGGHPRFELRSCIEWRREQDAKDRKKQDANAEKIDESVRRKAAADADLAELKRDQMRGELVPIADVRREMETLCRLVRSRVLGVRGRWAPRIIGLGTMQEATGVLDELSADVLTALEDSANDDEEVAA